MPQEKPKENHYTDQEVDRAWRYHQNADSMQHQRHVVFALIEAGLFAAFSQANSTLLEVIILSFGVLVASLWCTVANKLEDRLDAMREILRSGDRIWENYENVQPLKDWFGGRRVFNWYLPFLMIGFWLILLLLLATRR